MPLYNEETIDQTISKTRYEYAYEVTIDNPLNGTPSVSFKTATVERDNSTNQESYIGHRRVIKEPYTGNEAFNVIHPVTKEVVGQTDYDTLFASLYSLFFHVASKEDA